MQPNPSRLPDRKINVLVLEDKVTDAELIVHELRRAGFDPEWHRVETEEEFVGQLDSAPDIILADFRLPGFDGLRALRCLQERNLDIPFIIVSGALGDETAARCIKEGVTDYLLKDRLERLGLAVTNAIDERRLRAERKMVDEQLRQAQKMEVIGQLAGGIAHDFNNLLSVINGWTALLLEKRSFSDRTRKALMEVHIAGQRAAGLTRQLLFFSRKRAVELRPLDLNNVIEGVTTMLRRLIGENVGLELRLAPDPQIVEADDGMMEQVLMNFAVNARDAMPRGGMLAIESRSVELEAADIRGRSDARPGRFVCMSARDTGCGIPADLLPRIFEPFFTTKEDGQGTGLGLATVFGIVKQHQGWIEVESRVGAGTGFSVFLPIVTLPIDVVAKPDDVETAIGTGGETILVVEDETSVREFAVAVLQPYGYRVLRAGSGIDALEVWKWHSARIDLLLTDMVMPDDISGPELAARLLAEKPGLAVIFASGYRQEMKDEAFPEEKKARFIHKPYMPRQLARVVREALDERNQE